jgi:type I restriction enzyme R subunit
MATEADARLHKIDGQLAQAGWSEKQGNLSKEWSLKGTPRGKQVHEKPVSYEHATERVDYLLKGRDGKPIAIVEAKRDARDPLEGKRQAEEYADHIVALYHVRPFIFLTNGDMLLFYDRERGYPPRRISGFFRPEDLEQFVFQRQYSQPLHTVPLNTTIAGGGKRQYQIEAVGRIAESMEQRRRKFLMVMATGTGKTRTAICLVDVLMRARWVQRVLFLADRRELIRQAMGEFKEYLPHEHRARIEGGMVDHEARIHFATYPSMMQVYGQLSPGYYDLIIADESHRSIYRCYRDIFTHFDAMQLGMTATPTDYIDHNTFVLFDCRDGVPTYYYSYERAVSEGFLVKFKALAAQTNFQIYGIKAGQLAPDMQQYLQDQQIDLDDIDFEGSDLERRVTNTGTNDALIREFMEKCRKDASSTLPAKSIIFAVSHHHAMELLRSFHRLYPDRLPIAEVIDSHMERAEKLLDDFRRKDMPRVAISVDMLDTGIDIPAIQNLVFAKPVFSLVKFWQMIGRGTRLWTDPRTGESKKDFLIIDHWRNFDFFDLNPEGETPGLTTPLPVSLFRLRLDKLVALRRHGEVEQAARTVTQLQEMFVQLPRNNNNVAPHSSELDELVQAQAWDVLDDAQVEYLSRSIAPLLRFLPEVNLFAMTFEIETEQLAIAFLEGQIDQVARLRGHIQRSLCLLPTGLPQVQAQQQKLMFALSEGFWDHLEYGRILDLQEAFVPLMRYRQQQHKPMMTLNLPDSITSRRWIIYGPSGEGAFVDHYRMQVETLVKELAEQVPAFYKIKQASADEMPSSDELREIADVLYRPDLFITEEVLRRVYERSDVGLLDFLRHILGQRPLLSREEQVNTAFDAFIANHPHFTVTQVDFLRAMRAVVLRNTRLSATDLERAPFNRIGAAHRLFSTEEIKTIVDFANRYVA